MRRPVEGAKELNPWTVILDRYANNLRASGASESTIRLRVYHAKRFSRLALTPALVTVEALTAVVGAIDLSPESRKSLRSSAKRFFGWCLTAGIITADPSAYLPAVRVPPGLPRPAPDDVIALAVFDADPRVRAMLMLAAYAGLRCAEIARLHRKDVGAALRIVGKGGKVRMVPLHPLVRDTLPPSRGYLFPGKDDGHLSPLYVCKLIGRALPTGYTAHTLRHRFATAAYAVDRDLLAVQQLLGHSSTETTRRYTAIPNDALLRAVMNAGPIAA